MSKMWKGFLQTPYAARVKDYYRCGDGYHDVQMKGFCDDSDEGRHVIIDASIAEVIKRIKRATPCKCAECVTG